ncbi:MAG TPA: hypothetical protein VIW24_27795, partial [Aldersonia sp.]
DTVLRRVVAAVLLCVATVFVASAGVLLWAALAQSGSEGVVVLVAVAWLAVLAVRRCRRRFFGSDVRGRVLTSARLGGMASAEDEIVKRFGEWRAQYARLRARDPGDSAEVRMIAASLPDPAPVYTAMRRARHEAGHAVAAIARGAAIAHAHIHVGGGIGGQVQWTGYPRTDRADCLWDALVIALAGHVVDVDAGHTNDACSSSDMEAVQRAAFELVVNGHRPEGYDGPLDVYGVVDAARSAARRIVTEQAAAIGRVAVGLVEQKCLHDGQIRALLDLVEDSGGSP